MKKILSLWLLLGLLASVWPVTSHASDCPITYYSADYASAKWCYLSINSSSPSHLQYVAEQAYIGINTTNRPSGDGYLWAFIGTPETGFKIVNKAAGSTKILASPSVTGDGGSTYPTMQTEAGLDTDVYNTTWNIVADGMGVLIARAGETTYMNNRGSKLAYWTNHDAGSRIMISPANETLADLATPSLSPTGKTYMLVNRYTGKALGDGTVTISDVETHVGTSTSVTANPYDNSNVMWTLSADGGKWTLTNKATSNKLQTSPSSNYMPINATAASYYLRETGDGYYYLLAYTSVGTGDSEKIALNDDDGHSRIWMASGLRAEWELRDVTPATSITSGHYYRLHNVAYNNKTMRETYGKLTTEERNASTYSQIWKITTSGTGYSLQNVLTGNYIQATPGTSTQFSTGGSSATFYAHTGTQNGYTTFAFDNNDSGNTSLHCASTRDYNIVGWVYSGANASYWYLEEVSLSAADLSTCTTLRGQIALTDGNYYMFTSVSYPARSMAESNGKVTTPFTANTYSQIWKAKQSGSTYALQNALTDKYIQSQTSSSEQYQTGADPFYFNYIAKEDGGVVECTFQNPSSTWYGLHSASSQSYNVVGWNYEDDASWWTAEVVAVNSGDLTATKTTLSTDYTTQLATFFNDAACTELKPAYAAMSDASLRTAMSALPTALQDMAVAVKNDTWNANATRNNYEKRFRIHDYEIFSNCDLWDDITGTGPFAHLFHPTGIQASAGDFIYLFVDNDPADSDASLQVECVAGIDRKGAAYDLHAGYNVIYVPYDGEIFISYLLNNTAKSCNSYPDIKVHIEGGNCTGCFDMRGHGHTNSDWEWMKDNMFSGTYLHVKGNTTLLNCYRARVVDPSNTQDVERIMKIFDFVFDKLQTLAGCDQWKETGRYKIMTNNYDVTEGNPHWSGDHGYAQPGIWYAGIFNADNLSNVGTDGGHIWVISHELGHGHQTPITLSGQKESSNNSLAQCVNFLTTTDPVGQELFSTTRSSRGEGVEKMVENFNQSGGYSWIDYAGYRTDKSAGGGSDIWASNKFIFQLWLYFDYMGNYQPSGGNTGYSFINALYDALRDDPIVKSANSGSPRPATDDYLKLAQKAAEITETDLSEFFEAWGFWELEPTVSRTNDIPESKIWEFPDYTTTYVQTSQAQVNEVKAIMTAYPTKAGNIMFLSDRGVGSTLPTYNNAATSTFGDVGYYETYDDKVTAPYTATVDGTTITMSGGTGAVGFKIYDDEGNLVAISNKNTFTVTSAVATAVNAGTYTVKVSQGDGTDYVAASTGHAATYYERTATWTSGVPMLESTSTGNYSSGWFSAVAPFHGTISSLTLNLGTGSGSGVSRTNAYLAISRDLKSATTGFTASDFVAISTNTCGTSAYEVTMNFTPAVELTEGVTYYFYFVTESSGTYTTVNQRYYVVSSAVMRIGDVGNTSEKSHSYAVPFTSTMVLTGSPYYRMKCLRPTQLWSEYVYSNASNENKLWKTMDETVAVPITDSRYIWEATYNASDALILQNLGSSHYISKFTTTASNGSGVNYLSATAPADAETFVFASRSDEATGYVRLNSNTEPTSYLNTATNGDNYVGCHNATPNAGDRFIFQQVKTVNFVDGEDNPLAIAVNGGDAVSTIYVATDGTDVITLSDNYKYSFDGGSTYVNASTAASTITAAGSSDISVTVQHLAVTYNLIYNGAKIGEYGPVEVEIGETPIPANFNMAFTTYTADPSTIDLNTTEIDLTATWENSALQFVTGNPNTISKWYRVRMNSDLTKYMYNNSGVIAFLTDTKPSLDSQDYLWGFRGDPFNGFQIYNKGAGTTVALNNAIPCTVSAAGKLITFNIHEGNAGTKGYTATADTYFTLYDKANDNYLNYQGGAIRRWSADAGSTFMINAVKQVNFVDDGDDALAIAVNGGSAVSTIYVATDGSDSFTLPTGYKYTIGGTTYFTAANAAAAIAAAGTSDLTVTVEELAPVTDLAGLSNDKAYVITNARGTWQFVDNATAMTVVSGSYDTTAEAQQIAIINRNSNYYLFSVNAGKYLTASNTLTTAPTTNEQVEIVATGNATYPWFFRFKNMKDGEEKYTKNINVSGGIIKIDGWGPNGSNSSGTLDEGNRNAIIEAADFDATDAENMFIEQTISYTLKYGGATIDTESSVTVRRSGTAEEFMPASLDNGFMTYSYDPEIIEVGTTNVDVTATWNGPFEISSSYASGKWYTVGINTGAEATNNIWNYDNSNNRIVWGSVATNAYGSLSNNHLFCFVGDPYNGFSIYNKAAGDSKTLYKSTTLTEAATMETTGSLFKPKASTASGKTIANGYTCFKLRDDEVVLNNRAWESGTTLRGNNAYGAYSTCWFTKPADYVTAVIGSWVLNAPVGAVGTKAGITSTVYRDNLSTLRDNITADPFIIGTTLELPMLQTILHSADDSEVIALGRGYWRIENAYTSFATMPAIYYDSSADKLKWSTSALTDANKVVNIFEFRNGSADGKYTLYSPQAEKYLSSTTTARSAEIGNTMGTPGTDVTFTSLGDAQYVFAVGSSEYAVHANGHSNGGGTNGTLVGWNVGGNPGVAVAGNKNSPSAWYIVKVEDIDITLNDGTNLNGQANSYATTYLPFPVTLPSGVNAYLMSTTKNTNAGGIEYIKPTLLGQKIPAKTPVLLIGDEGKGTIMASLGITGDSPSTDGNALRGTYADIAGVANTYLVLGQSGGTVGFYKLKESKKIPAYRAYFLIDDFSSGSVNGYSIGWDFDWEDGVEDLQMENGKWLNGKCIYDLQGRKVSDSTLHSPLSTLKKGIYIINGKKVMIK